jgi:hypothetical protein
MIQPLVYRGLVFTKDPSSTTDVSPTRKTIKYWGNSNVKGRQKNYDTLGASVHKKEKRK